MTHERPWLAAKGLAMLGVLAGCVAGLDLVLPTVSSAAAWEQGFSDGVPVEVEPWLENNGERFDPATFLPQSHRLDAEGHDLLTAPCTAIGRAQKSVELRKLARFRLARCAGTGLSESELDEPPFMHPMGRSYASRQGAPAPLHLEEQATHPLAALSPRVRSALVAGHAQGVGPNWVIRRGAADWRLLSRKDFDGRLSWLGFSRVPSCERPSCLNRTPRTWATWAFWIGVFGLLGAGALAAFVAIRQWRTHRAAEQFVIRTLTHELRTPSTAVGLELARIRPYFDELPVDVQDAFLALTSANTRLRTTLESTGSVLSVRGGRVVPDSVDVPTMLVSLGEIPEGQGEVRTDPQHLRIILQNVLSNAHTHGEPPVRTRVKRVRGGVELVIEDAGRFDGDPTRFTEPFVKGPNSQGLGLGLTLVRDALVVLGGRLDLSSSPTQLTLYIPDC